MQTNKIISILLILGVFVGFCTFDLVRKSEKKVLNVKSSAVIELENEIICIPDIETFTADLSKNQSELENKYKINHADALKMGYLSDNYADGILSGKRVKVKYTGIQNQNCKFADIYINGQSYKDLFLKSGFDLSGDFSAKLKAAKELNLVILNHKNGKFHTLECKYGQAAHDVTILPERQLPQSAVPCKFCHIKKSSAPPVKTYPLVISNGDIKMYLTDLTMTLIPDNKCTTLVCRELLSLINSAQKSADIALYGWGEVPEIHNALLKAKQRGVKIRVVYDISTDNYYPETETLLSLAEDKSGDNPQILMHNKFIIIDDEKLLTGSMNFAPTGLSGFNSNCIFSINSPEIVKIYKEEFEQMLKGKFHNAKSPHQKQMVQLHETKITPLFSPKDGIITNSIIPLINNAQNYIYIPAFILTHDELSKALVRAKERNVDVKIIADASNAAKPRSKVKFLRTAGIPVKVENYAGKLHSKSIIIDDKYVIAGSMNFSNSGENKNDENCLIIENERFAKYYGEFFEYLWAKIPDKYLNITPRAEGKSSIGSCFDGIDNNYDGKIDAADDACK